MTLSERAIFREVSRQATISPVAARRAGRFRGCEARRARIPLRARPEINAASGRRCEVFSGMPARSSLNQNAASGPA